MSFDLGSFFATVNIYVWLWYESQSWTAWPNFSGLIIYSKTIFRNHRNFRAKTHAISCTEHAHVLCERDCNASSHELASVTRCLSVDFTKPSLKFYQMGRSFTRFSFHPPPDFMRNIPFLAARTFSGYLIKRCWWNGFINLGVTDELWES